MIRYVNIRYKLTRQGTIAHGSNAADSVPISVKLRFSVDFVTIFISAEEKSSRKLMV